GLRALYPDRAMYSWWDYRSSGFRRGWGLRIDHLLLSDSLKVQAGDIDIAYCGLERPSDHAPVWLQIE
ncbi:MAG: exodeoxyribonuclease III, partial [Mariprofundus sp.]|nr:exodeoxyribonuclease III [Mariprofundus sp.]